MRPVSALCCVSWCALVACADQSTRIVELVRVSPAADATCGAPADGRTLLITALGDFPATEATASSRELALAGRLDIDSFPLTTRALAVEVIGRGGVLRAMGMTAPFDLGALADGDRISVFMAPPAGACPTGPPAVSRIRPLLAATAHGALIAGGVDAAGQPVHEVEHYDAATGAFAIVAERLYGTPSLGLLGASATSLSDGRVVLAGGPAPAYQIYDPQTRAFSAALFLGTSRAFHAAVALDDAGSMLLAGGCGALAPDGSCEPGQALVSTAILDVDTGTVREGPTLAAARIGGMAVRQGADSVLLVGGVDAQGVPMTSAERIRLTSGQAGQGILIQGAGAAAAPLAAGSVLTAFAPAHAEPSAAAAILAPAASRSSPAGSGNVLAPRAGATLTTLQDGRVLVLGGMDPVRDPVALLYEPARNLFEPLTIDGLPLLAMPDASGPASAGHGPEHGAVLLADGTVLVIDGRARAGAPPDDHRAWIIRPELTGPFASDALIAFADTELSRHLVPRDPGRAARIPGSAGAGPHYRLESSASSGLPSEWVVIAGPVFTRARIAARVATSAGLAMLLGFRTPDDYTALILIPGQPATVLRLEQGTASAVEPCRGQVIQAAQLQAGAAAPLLEVQVGDDTIAAILDDNEILTCTGIEFLPSGHIGLGVIGAAGAILRLDSITVRRLPE